METPPLLEISRRFSGLSLLFVEVELMETKDLLLSRLDTPQSLLFVEVELMETINRLL
jgi:hypothetical protein